MTASLEPAASRTDASSLTSTSDYESIVLLACLVGFKPLYTGPESEYCRIRQREIKILSKEDDKPLS
jgi:radical SAM superfamily enzyme YgiQ (UPF0313 family)